MTSAGASLSKRPVPLLREALLVGLPALLFAGLLLIVVENAPTGFDRDLAGRMQAVSWGPADSLPALVSDIGGGVYGFYLLPALLGLFLAWKREWRLLIPLAALFALHYVAISPKAFIDAYRPSPEFGVAGAGGLESFPSGHSQWAASFYGFVAYVAWRQTSGRARYLVAAACAAVVVLTMLSRIELGRHWPIDTVAGMLVGLITLRLLVALHGLSERRWGSRRTATLAERASTP